MYEASVASALSVRSRFGSRLVLIWTRSIQDESRCREMALTRPKEVFVERQAALMEHHEVIIIIISAPIIIITIIISISAGGENDEL